MSGVIVDCDKETGLAKNIESFIYGGDLGEGRRGRGGGDEEKVGPEFGSNFSQNFHVIGNSIFLPTQPE